MLRVHNGLVNLSFLEIRIVPKMIRKAGRIRTTGANAFQTIQEFRTTNNHIVAISGRMLSILIFIGLAELINNYKKEIKGGITPTRPLSLNLGVYNAAKTFVKKQLVHTRKRKLSLIILLPVVLSDNRHLFVICACTTSLFI